MDKGRIKAGKRSPARLRAWGVSAQRPVWDAIICVRAELMRRFASATQGPLAVRSTLNMAIMPSALVNLVQALVQVQLHVATLCARCLCFRFGCAELQ